VCFERFEHLDDYFLAAEIFIFDADTSLHGGNGAGTLPFQAPKP